MADSEPIDARLSRIETRLDGVESRLDGVERKVDGLAADVKILNVRVDGLSQKVDGLSQRVDHLDHRMQVGFEHIDERFAGMADAFDSLRQHMDRRFAEERAERQADRQMFYDILGNHEGRLRDLEGRTERPS